MIIKKHVKQTCFNLLFGSLILLFLVACGAPPAEEPPAEPAAIATATSPSDDSTITEPVTEEVESAYPAPDGYPAPAQDTVEQGYPPPTLAITEDGIRFSIDSETKAGDTVVRGTAPPNLSIAILDVTLNGTVLGMGVSDDAGNYEISVSPLASSRRIGIVFAQLENGMADLGEMVEFYLPNRGDQFMNIPNVGIFMETKMIE